MQRPGQTLVIMGNSRSEERFHIQERNIFFESIRYLFNVICWTGKEKNNNKSHKKLRKWKNFLVFFVIKYLMNKEASIVTCIFMVNLPSDSFSGNDFSYTSSSHLAPEITHL